jgi:hypothetical protein
MSSLSASRFDGGWGLLKRPQRVDVSWDYEGGPPLRAITYAREHEIRARGLGVYSLN